MAQFSFKSTYKAKRWQAIVRTIGNKILQQRVQQPPQPNTRNNQHQQTKQGLIEHKKDHLVELSRIVQSRSSYPPLLNPGKW